MVIFPFHTPMKLYLLYEVISQSHVYHCGKRCDRPHHFYSENANKEFSFRHLFTCIYHLIHIFHCLCEPKTL